MEILKAIHTRRSIRKYEDRPVPVTLIRELLAAAMSAPSGANQQPWHFMIIDDREVLDQVPEINPAATMVWKAHQAILIVADLNLVKLPDYWVLDCAAAAQNLLLAAHGLCLGAVWTAIYPEEERIDEFRQLLGLPQHIVPHTLIPIGYPAEECIKQNRFREDRIHYNVWENPMHEEVAEPVLAVGHR